MSIALTSRPGGSTRSVVRRSLLTLWFALLLTATGTAFAATASATSVPSCASTQLSARIVDWQGAAGSRIADVILVNTSFVKCTIRNFPRVQMVDRYGHLLISGPAASSSGALHTLAPLGFLKTEVSASNYCGPAYTAPVTLTFRLTGSLGRIVAMPRSSADTAGVPPCFGAPGSAGHISMHAWHT